MSVGATPTSAWRICSGRLYIRYAIVGRNRRRRLLPLTQSDLADALGLSTVYVNKTITRLRVLGVIETDRRQIRILQPDELRAIAASDASYLQQQSTSPGIFGRLRSGTSE